MCAVKKIESVFEHRGIAKRTLRELIFLRHFKGHENILDLQRVMRPLRNAKDVYLVSDLMETDLACVIRSKQVLTDDHVQFFIYQVLRGLKYIHSANVLHRDLKPRNLLVNSNCDLKICDFGLARFNSTFDRTSMSDYIATRWYRAPEIILTKGKYSFPIDMWAVGCILGELLQREPMFPGRDEVHQLYLIKKMVGSFDSRKRNTKAALTRHFSKAAKIPCNPLALDLLAKLLAMDPKERPTVEEALAHPYLSELHEVDDEPGYPLLDENEFLFEKRGVSRDSLKARIEQEILEYNPIDTNVYPMGEGTAYTGGEKKKKPRKRTHKRRSSF